MEASVTAEELVRPWRRATVIATLIAAVELVLLIAGVAVLVAPTLAHAVQHRAEQHVQKAVPTVPAPVRKAIAQRHAPPPKATHPRADMKVLVLNGNGRTGVAHAEAEKLQSLGYEIAGAADAHRHDYATSLVMYRPGYRPEGLRLARDLHVPVVGPIDGVNLAQLHGGQLAVILGAR